MYVEVDVELRAFQDGPTPKIRKVRVPMKEWNACGSIEEKLERVFYWGQNDFQPVEGCYSVSMRDVAIIDGERWVCAMVGWEKIDG